MNKKIISVTTSSFAQEEPKLLSQLRENFQEVRLNETGKTLGDSKSIEKMLYNCIGVIAGTENYDEGVLKALPDLRVISRIGAGISNINVEVARELNIKVFNTPDAVTPAVAELALGMILSLCRHIHQSDHQLKSKIWKKTMGRLLQGQTVGIVGFGRIGKALAKLLKPFDCPIVVYDPYYKEEGLGVKSVSFKEILEQGEIISFHASGKETLWGEKELALTKRKPLLINLSRGGILDEKILLQGLESGQISGAALDVFVQEPYEGPLLNHPSVLVTPHIGSYAREARIQMEKEAVENLLKGLG